MVESVHLKEVRPNFAFARHVLVLQKAGFAEIILCAALASAA
jgi:hypothetical protein